MSALSNLKLSTAKRPQSMPVVLIRRNKLIKKLYEQIQLAEAQQAGDTYMAKRLKNVRDTETGLTKTVEVNKRVRAWWWTGDNGKLCLNVKYGSNTIELSKGKFAIELAGTAELVPVLNTLKDAAEAGELDSQIEGVAGVVKSGFGK